MEKPSDFKIRQDKALYSYTPISLAEFDQKFEQLALKRTYWERINDYFYKLIIWTGWLSLLSCIVLYFYPEALYKLIGASLGQSVDQSLLKELENLQKQNPELQKQLQELQQQKPDMQKQLEELQKLNGASLEKQLEELQKIQKVHITPTTVANGSEPKAMPAVDPSQLSPNPLETQPENAPSKPAVELPNPSPMDGLPQTGPAIEPAPVQDLPKTEPALPKTEPASELPTAKPDVGLPIAGQPKAMSPQAEIPNAPLAGESPKTEPPAINPSGAPAIGPSGVPAINPSGAPAIGPSGAPAMPMPEVPQPGTGMASGPETVGPAAAVPDPATQASPTQPEGGPAVVVPDPATQATPTEPEGGPAVVVPDPATQPKGSLEQQGKTAVGITQLYSELHASGKMSLYIRFGHSYRIFRIGLVVEQWLFYTETVDCSSTWVILNLQVPVKYRDQPKIEVLYVYPNEIQCPKLEAISEKQKQEVMRQGPFGLQCLPLPAFFYDFGEYIYLYDPTIFKSALVRFHDQQTTRIQNPQCLPMVKIKKPYSGSVTVYECEILGKKRSKPEIACYDVEFIEQAARFFKEKF